MRWEAQTALQKSRTWCALQVSRQVSDAADAVGIVVFVMLTVFGLLDVLVPFMGNTVAFVRPKARATTMAPKTFFGPMVEDCRLLCLVTCEVGISRKSLGIMVRVAKY